MDLFDVLSLIGGLCLFLFGMQLMGESLERRAGSSLRTLLAKLTTGKLAGLFTGMGVTAVIQSSSASTVMVVGFVNSGLMTLRQAIHVIMGANIGTTVTAWILSLGGIDSSNLFVRLLKPSSFTPILALVGIILMMFLKDSKGSSKNRDTGMILLGFAVLMFGMEAMSDAVSGLRDVPAFGQMLLIFSNPILGVLAGAILTAIIQSSSASVGILQALSATGQVTMGTAIPIIMGQNIGTCITAMLSSVGTNKNARRAALVHLCFNIIGTVLCLVLFMIIQAALAPALLDESATRMGIAVAHSVFNVICTLALLPLAGFLEKLVCRLIPDDRKADEIAELDERLLATPALALDQCRAVAADMAKCSVRALENGLVALETGKPEEVANAVMEDEDLSDHYEDILGSYLVKLSARRISTGDSNAAAELLRLIGDFERIADHGANLIESAQELQAKGLAFSGPAAQELKVLFAAAREILDTTMAAYQQQDIMLASRVEPLEQVIDGLRETMRTRHIVRLQRGECSIDAGFVWSDLLTALERTADHCSNIAACVIDMQQGELNLHESLRATRAGDPEFARQYGDYARKYALPRN